MVHILRSQYILVFIPISRGGHHSRGVNDASLYGHDGDVSVKSWSHSTVRYCRHTLPIVKYSLPQSDIMAIDTCMFKLLMTGRLY